MILIADSGSTKTDWIIIGESQEVSFKSAGYNPQVVNQEFVKSDLSSSFPALFNRDEIHKIYFYGAGCSSESSKIKMKRILASFFTKGEIEVQSDLLAACRSLLGDGKGIVGILGTGSNACYYNGESIVQKSTNLGYLMGDEGSGNEISRRIIKLCLYNKLDKAISSKIIPNDISENEFVSSIYSQDRVNQYLASFMPKIYPFKDNSMIKSEIENSFRAYFENHISIYTETSDIYLTGSISALFRAELEDISMSFNKNLKKVIKSPIEGLKEYHLKS